MVHKIHACFSIGFVTSIYAVLFGYHLVLKSQTGEFTPRPSNTSVEDVSENYTAQYSVLIGDTIVNGRWFSFNAGYLRQFGFPIIFNETMKKETATAKEIVFVTAFDAGYFEIGMDSIASVQKHFPGQKIIFYDLRKNPTQVLKIKELCNVEYRLFNYSWYPPHVQRLKSYTFKPLIVHEALQSHDVIFWLDSSIRFSSGDLTVALNRADNSGGGPIMFENGRHSILSATHSVMFDYLPMERKMAIAYNMYGANSIILYRNRETYDSIIRWWFLCALEETCMTPTTDLYCSFSKTEFRTAYAGCHRYDQSAINILAIHRQTHQYLQRADTSHLRSSDISPAKRSRRVNVSTQLMLTDLYYSPGPVIIARRHFHNAHLNVCNGVAAGIKNISVQLIPVRTHFSP